MPANIFREMHDIQKLRALSEDVAKIASNTRAMFQNAKVALKINAKGQTIIKQFIHK